MEQKKKLHPRHIWFALWLVFTILTFAGAVYVIVSHQNAGYAVIPMIFSIACSSQLQRCRKTNKQANS